MYVVVLRIVSAAGSVCMCCLYMSDVQQITAGSCALNDIAVKVATRVIGHYPHRNQLVVDAGWMAMSLDGQGKLPTGSYCLFQDHPDLR